MSDRQVQRDLPILDELRDLLPHTGGWGDNVRGYREINSTNDLARAWASDSAPEGSVVIAEKQTAGRGRLGRRWEAAAGKNLLFSVILRPDLPDDRRGLVTLAASVAVAETIASVTSPYTPSIKWPNDIYLKQRKCCGMLLESVSSSAGSGTRSGVILGVGLNVNQVSFPRELENRATSLRLVAGRLIERAPLLAGLLPAIRGRYEQILHDEEPAVRRAFEERMLYTNQRVILRYTDTDSAVEGVVEGVDPTGGLRLRCEHGRETFHAGEVTFRSASDDTTV